LFTLTLGGIYWGWFSPTEAAAIGAFGALLLGLALRRLGMKQAVIAFIDTVRTTSALTLIVMGSTLFSYFVVQTGIAKNIADLLARSGLGPSIVMLLIVIFYIALGCFLEGIGMVLVTVPILLPVVLANGFDPVWFGVVLVIVVEIGLIHPPVGMNLFVIRAQAPQLDIREMYLGVLPFLVAPLVLVALLIAYPQIALWLPDHIR
jgi:tripartite ATP-independent transporter DctM subunit